MRAGGPGAGRWAVRTPHPAIAESLSGEFERETREAPLRARIAELEGRLAIIVKWLEENQPDVFRRGLWDEISAPTAQALARLVEAVGMEIGAEEDAGALVDLVFGGVQLHSGELLGARKKLKEARDGTRKAYRAYLAARSGRGEGET